MQSKNHPSFCAILISVLIVSVHFGDAKNSTKMYESSLISEQTPGTESKSLTPNISSVSTPDFPSVTLTTFLASVSQLASNVSDLASPKEASNAVTIVPIVSSTAGDANLSDDKVLDANGLASNYSDAKSEAISANGTNDETPKVSVLINQDNDGKNVTGSNYGNATQMDAKEEDAKEENDANKNGRQDSNHNETTGSLLSVDQSVASNFSVVSITASPFSTPSSLSSSSTPTFPHSTNHAPLSSTLASRVEKDANKNGSQEESSIPIFAPLIASQDATDNNHRRYIDSPVNVQSNKLDTNVMTDPERNERRCPVVCTCSLTTTPFLQPETTLLRTVNCSNIGADISFTISNIPRDAENLILSRNNLLSIDQTLVDLQTLPYQNSNQEKLRFEHLIILDLSYNRIKQIGRPNIQVSHQHLFKEYSHIKILDISGNEFKTLYANTFHGLKRLESLIMKNGMLKYLDEHSLSGLENLKNLDLSGNKISSIYLELFQNIPNIEKLSLASNQISHLSNGVFASLNSLKILDLSANQIASLNDNAFVGLDATLLSLDLSTNQLVHVPSVALQTLKRLQTLKLSGNLFKTLSTGDFVHSPIISVHLDNLPNLETADRGAFWDLPSLASIYLHSNPKLYYLDPNTFLGVPSLQTLQLHNNSLVTLQEEMVNNLIHRRALGSFTNEREIQNYDAKLNNSTRDRLEITFWSNPIRCDCNAAFLLKCLKSADSCSVTLQEFDTRDAIKDANIRDANVGGDANINGDAESDAIVCSFPPNLIGIKVSQLFLNPETLQDNDQTPQENNQTPKEGDAKKDLNFGANTTSNDVLSFGDAKLISIVCPPIILDETLIGERPESDSVHYEGARASNHTTAIIRKRIGERVTLTCHVLSPMASSITWILPSGQLINETLASHKYQSFDNGPLSHLSVKSNPGTLKLPHLSSHDAGIYTCVTSNNYGHDRKNFQLIIDAIDLHIWPLGVSSTFVTIMWNGTSRNSFPAFHLLYRELDANILAPNEDYYNDDDNDHEEIRSNWNNYQVISVSHFLRSYTINHLTPRKKYKLCIGLKDEDPHLQDARAERKDAEAQAVINLESEPKLRVTRHYQHAHASYEHPNETPVNDLFPTPATIPRHAHNHYLQLSCTIVTTQPHGYLMGTANQVPGSHFMVTLSLLSLISIFLSLMIYVTYITFRRLKFRHAYEEATPSKRLLIHRCSCAHAHHNHHYHPYHNSQVMDTSCCSTPDINRSRPDVSRIKIGQMLKETTFTHAHENGAKIVSNENSFPRSTNESLNINETLSSKSADFMASEEKIPMEENVSKNSLA